MTGILVVDIETLGMAPPAALIELGWQGLSLTDDGYWAMGPQQGEQLFGMAGQTMPPDNRAVHHIDPERLEGLKPFSMDDWNGAGLDDIAYAAAHNQAFEAQWLDFGLPWICTYKCAMRQWPEAPSHGNQALKYFLGVADRGSHHPPHRALPDARVTAEILVRLLALQPVETLLRWTLEPRLVTVMPFGKHKGQRLADLPRDYLRWVAGPGCEAADADLKHWCNAFAEGDR